VASAFFLTQFSAILVIQTHTIDWTLLHSCYWITYHCWSWNYCV